MREEVKKKNPRRVVDAAGICGVHTLPFWWEGWWEVTLT